MEEQWYLMEDLTELQQLEILEYSKDRNYGKLD